MKMKNIFKYFILILLISACTNSVKEKIIEEKIIIDTIKDFKIDSTENTHVSLKKMLIYFSVNWEVLINKADASSFWKNTGIRTRYRAIKNTMSINIIGTLLDEDVFSAGPHNYDFDYNNSIFGKYNPKFLSKLHKELTILYKDKEFVNNFQNLYNSQLKRFLQTYYLSYSYFANNNKHIFNNFDGTPRVNHLNISYEFADDLKQKNYDFYEAITSSSFWVRRSIDGTSNEFFKLLTLTLKTFDNDFLKENIVEEIKMQDSFNYEQWIEFLEERTDC